MRRLDFTNVGATYGDVQRREIVAYHVSNASVVLAFRFRQILDRVAQTLLHNLLSVILTARRNTCFVVGEIDRSVLRGREIPYCGICINR
jgi:hypothetical protein